MSRPAVFDLMVKGDTIGWIAKRIGVPLKEVGNNILLNGEYLELAWPGSRAIGAVFSPTTCDFCRSCTSASVSAGMSNLIRVEVRLHPSS